MRFATRLPALLVLLCGNAFAHEMHVFASVENGVIHGKVTYGDSSPASNVTVRVTGPSNDAFAELQTDAEGRVTFAPSQRVRHTLIAETVDGHRAQYNVDAAEIGELAAGATAATVEAPSDWDARIAAAIAREIRPLREQIDAYESATRFRDVVGGIGYIVGVAGLFALIRARNRSGG